MTGDYLKNLWPGVCLGTLAWLFLTAGVGWGMAPLQDQQRQQAVQELYENYKKNFPGVPEVTPEEAMKLQQAGQAVFVDVRPLLGTAGIKIAGSCRRGRFLDGVRTVTRVKP